MSFNYLGNQLKHKTSVAMTLDSYDTHVPVCIYTNGMRSFNANLGTQVTLVFQVQGLYPRCSTKLPLLERPRQRFMSLTALAPLSSPWRSLPAGQAKGNQNLPQSCFASPLYCLPIFQKTGSTDATSEDTLTTGCSGWTPAAKMVLSPGTQCNTSTSYYFLTP